MKAMLNDTKRNACYRKAIARSIKEYKRKNGDKIPLVLDIGTGTGLLAMFAAKEGKKVSPNNFHEFIIFLQELKL